MIPEHATKVFDGQMIKVYQWPQKLFDGKIKTFEASTTRDIVKIIAIHNGKITICYDEQPHQKPRLTLPGGFMEENEAPLESAKRELSEETGLTSNDWIPFETYDFPFKVYSKYHVFIAKNCEKTQEQRLDQGGEKITVSYATFDEFMKIAIENFYAPFVLDLVLMERNKTLDKFKESLFSKD